MTNIYLRNNTFYYRKSIPNHLKLFFQNKKLYIRTLSTKSKTLALKYAKLLNNKFSAIKEVYSMSFDINLIYQLVEEFHNTQLELTENDLRNTPKPEDTLFAILLEDSIEQLQHNYQNNIFDSEEIQIILNKLHYKPNNEEITQIGKILLDSKINHLKTINDNLNKGLYYKARKVSCNNKITTIKENIQEVEEVNTIASTFDKYIQYQSKQDNWSNDTLQLNIRVFKLLNMYFKDKSLKDIRFDDLIDFRDTLLEVPLAAPLFGSDILGGDESNTKYWGHIGNSLISKIDFKETQWYCKTSNHNRVIHFKNNSEQLNNYIKTGIGTHDITLFKNKITLLNKHFNAYLPYQTILSHSNKGDNVLINHLFYYSEAYHFNVGSLNTWTCDDVSVNPNTFHQVFVR